MARFRPIELQIFLHFINREASDAGELARPEKADLEILRIILLSHSAKLSVNISQMLEYLHGRPALSAFMHSLFRAGLLETTSHDTDLERFIEARQRMYAHVQSRYPMYFASDQELGRFAITKNNSFSMSKLLQEDLLGIRSGELPTFAPLALHQDKIILSDNIDAIQKAIFHNRDAAVTSPSLKALTKAGSMTPADWRSVGRIFSAQYFEKYASQNLQRICTGVTSKSFLDDLSTFPNYDIPVLRGFLRLLGVPFDLTDQSNIAELIEAHGTNIHLDFVDTLQTFILGLYAAFESRLNSANLNADNVQSYRDAFIAFSGESVMRSSIVARPVGESLLDGMKRATLELEWLSAYAGRIYPSFTEIWKEHNKMSESKVFVILVATSTEDERLSTALLAQNFINDGPVDLGGLFATQYRSPQNALVYKVRSSAGSIGPSGSTLVTSEAIKALRPNYVISMGICFGLKEKKHKMSDVLVSEHILDYETIRDGAVEATERGMRVPAGRGLLSAAWSTAAQGGRTYGVHFGLVVSGQKLIDSLDTIEELRNRFPDALGGEMEGSGIVSAALPEGTEWILVKGICDWGHGKGEVVSRKW